jgi:hypothetical protein
VLDNHKLQEKLVESGKDWGKLSLFTQARVNELSVPLISAFGPGKLVNGRARMAYENSDIN